MGPKIGRVLMMRRIFWVTLCSLAMTGSAYGQSKGSASSGDEASQSAKKKEAPKVKVERGAGGRKTFRITTAFVIEGRIQKPNAFYVLQRSQINYDWAKLTKDFTPRIVDAVETSPF